MALLRIQDFSGEVPVKGDRAIPDAFATDTLNTWFYGSELRGVRPPEQIIAVLGTTRKVFRVPKGTVGADPEHPGEIPPPSYLPDSVWVQFTDQDTDIVRGQLVEDSFKRWYFCSPSTGPVFNTYARLLAGQTAYKLGVPGPNVDPLTSTNTPTISSITGGSAPVVTRSYVYTWVNDFGEESYPSLPVTGAGNANGTWNIAGIDDPAPVAGYADYDKKYLYRTITGASGQTTYYRVAEIALATTTYADDGSVMTDAVLANNLILESVSWQLPPLTMKGFVAMPNGFLIGFDDSNVYMSEPYHFHAWPPEYKQASEFPIVGLAVHGQTCVVCTQGYPATITGVKPATCAFTKATTGEPCLSRSGIVATPSGVLYPSQNGLILVGPGGIQNVISPLMTREQWLKKYAPTHLHAVRYQEGYLALRHHHDAAGGNTGFYIDPSSIKVALTELSDWEDVVGISQDVWSGEVFFIKDSAIWRWDVPSEEMLPVLWKSKEFQYLKEANFGCYALFWDDARFSTNDFGLGFINTDTRARLRVFVDRVLRYDEEVPRNGKGVRLPSGFKGDIWQFEIRARCPVYALHVASTMKELQGA